MRAGRLRHRIDVQQATKTRTASGGYEETWTTVATVWGAVEPLRGREYFENAQVQSEATHRITLRYRAGVSPDDRLRHSTENRIFLPLSVLNRDERNVSLEIMAKEVVG